MKKTINELSMRRARKILKAVREGREDWREDWRELRRSVKASRDEYKATQQLGDKFKRAKHAGEIAHDVTMWSQIVVGVPFLAAAVKFEENILPRLQDIGTAAVIGGVCIVAPVLVKTGLLDPKHLGRGLPVDFYGGLMSGEPLMGRHKWAYRAENLPEEEL